MPAFFIALTNVLVTLGCIVPGYLLRKFCKASETHLPTLSAILVYIGTPFLEFSSFISLKYEPGHLASMAVFFAVSLAAQLAFCLIFYAAAGKKRRQLEVRVINVASVLGNVGYFGLPLVRALLPDDPLAVCCATLFIVSMNMITFTLGVYLLTGNKKHVSVRSALLNPATISLAISLPFYLFGWGELLPAPVTSAVGNIAGMTAPLCMFILGIRLAASGARKLFSRPKVYLASALKLIVFPLFCWLLTLPAPLDPALKLTLVILAATPCASHTLNFSEIYHVDPELAANCILISTMFCFLTLPLATLLPF